MMFAPAALDLGNVVVSDKWSANQGQVERTVDALNAKPGAKGDYWFVAYWNPTAEAWQRVLSPDEYMAAKTHAGVMASALAAFDAEFGGV